MSGVAVAGAAGVPGLVLWPFAVALAALLGSFLNVCISRLPRGESIVLPASHCPHCRTPIRYADNVPLVSFALLGGRCRACRAPISWRYPLVEALAIGVAALVLWRLGPTWAGMRVFLFALGLISVTFTDFEARLIPDWVTLPGIVAGLALDPAGPSLRGAGALAGALALLAVQAARWRTRAGTTPIGLAAAGRGPDGPPVVRAGAGPAGEAASTPAEDRRFALLGGAALGALAGRQLAALVLPWGEPAAPGAGLAWSLMGRVDPLVAGCVLAGGVLYLIALLSPLVFGKEGMGGGDIKLAAMMGAFLGVDGALVGLFLGVMAGGVSAILLLALGLRRFGEYLSFGPFLALGALLAALWGPDLVRTYSTLMERSLG